MLCFEKILLYLFVEVIFILSFTSNCTGIGGLFSSSQCRPPSSAFRHGKVRTRQRGRLAKYQCLWGYELVGQRYSSCVGKAWDSPPPVCVRPGCLKVGELQNGLMASSNKNAVVRFFCNPGFAMIGKDFIYCDGQTWNGTAPKCESNANVEPAKSCDFEDDSLCGWTHDPLHDFDWRRQNKQTPSGHSRTGPSYDHTYGIGNEGYYMYIESTSRVENDTARLISPVYPSSLTQSGCFSFYYHMYGWTIGTLRVLVHPSSIGLSDILQDPDTKAKYTMFQESGNQGDYWFRGLFDLDVWQENFQIVIEGVRGSGYVSDIAIDDVAILQADQCVNLKETHQTSINVPSPTAIGSCFNRCNVTDSEHCDCFDGCEEQNSCCVDYLDTCVFDAVSTTVETEATYNENESVSSYKSDTPPTSLKIFATKTQSSTETEPPTTSTTVTPKTVKTTQQTQTTRQTTFRPTTKVLTYKPVKSTYRSTSTTRYLTTKTTKPSTKITSTTQKLYNLNTVSYNNKSSTKQKTVPILQFNTPAVPLTNATGILKKAIDEVENIPVKANKTATANKTPSSGTKNDTGNPKVKVFTTARPIKAYSKTFDHYSKNPIKFTITTTKEGIASKNKNILLYNEDAHVAESDAKKSSSPEVIIITVVLVITCVGVILFLMRSGRLRKLLDKGRVRIRLNSKSSTNADMKFLVHEEELEHDYED